MCRYLTIRYVVEELAQRADDLESRLNEEIERNAVEKAR